MTAVVPPHGYHPRVKDLPILPESRAALTEKELEAEAIWDPYMGLYMTSGNAAPLRPKKSMKTLGRLGENTVEDRFVQPVLRTTLGVAAGSTA